MLDFFIEQSLQIVGVWSFYKAMYDRTESFLLQNATGQRPFVKLELCFPLAPTFDKCCLVLNNTEHLLNKEPNI